jgi:hypothetical protein
MKKVSKVQLKLELEGRGLVNYNGSNPHKRFVGKMMSNGKTNNNGSFAKENHYKKTIIDKDGKEKEVLVPKKVISSNLLRKMICGDENLVNADKLISISKLRTSLLSQDNTILRGYAILKDKTNLKRKSALTVSDAEQTSDTETWLETRTAEGERDDTSLFFKENCGAIEYASKIFFDIKQLQFISIDDNYDRMSLKETDVEPFIKHINGRYGDGNAKYGNWGTTHLNVIGEQGIVLSDKVVTNIVRETIKRILAVEVKRSDAYARTKGLEIALGHEGDEIDLLTKPKFVRINNIEEYDKLMQDRVIGVDFLDIEPPTIEKKEKKPKGKS